MRIRRHLLLLTLVFLGSACGSAGLRTGGPYPQGSAPDEGLRYYVARNVITVDARVISQKGGYFKWVPAGEGQPCTLASLPPVWRRTVYELATPLAPDRRHPFRLGIVPSRTVEQTLKVTITDDGLLTSLNYGAQDRSAEIAGSILRGVAGVAGTFLGVSNFGSVVPGLKGNKVLMVNGRRMVPTLHLPLTEHCYVNSGDTRAAELAQDLFLLQQQIKQAEAEHENVLARAAQARSLGEVRRLRGQDSLLTRREALLRERFAAVRAALSVAATAHAADKKVGVREDTVRIQRTFDLPDLPSKLGGTTLATALNSVTSKEAQDFFQQTNLLVVLVEPRESTQNLGQVGNPQSQLSSLACRDEAEEKCARIRYRQPILREIRVFAPSGSDTHSPLELQELRTLPLISSGDPVLNVAVNAKTLGEGKATLVFGRYSNIISLEQASNAGLAKATSTLADALSGARQEFLNGLQAAQTTQTTVTSMRANARAERIKELSDQKALIDAQVALEGANANRDLLKQKQEVDAQLALLEAQQDLETTQRSGAAAGELADLRSEVQRLQLELELVRQQLELEKARRELESSRSQE